MTKTLTGTPYYKDYIVKLTGTINSASEEKQFTLRVSNPCSDLTKNLISSPNDFSIDYKLQSNVLQVDYSAGYSFIHASSLCSSAMTYQVVGGDYTKGVSNDSIGYILSVNSAD